MNIPPDDVDMSSIFRCVQRAIEEKVENNLSEKEVALAPSNQREMDAVVSEIGETAIPMMFNCEYPFGDFVKDYEEWYRDNFALQFLKMKIQAISEEKE
jgi:hypothetical protein